MRGKCAEENHTLGVPPDTYRRSADALVDIWYCDHLGEYFLPAGPNCRRGAASRAEPGGSRSEKRPPST
ncbi:hypothetical protein AB0D14_31590 [Streptomyces sp. NPDC048484]|uniref:hypothetical protein n=1 Tax=Streptomyces sp. NPDC048484 TaxID=3155146 RepID=UPI003417CF20